MFKILKNIIRLLRIRICKVSSSNFKIKYIIYTSLKKNMRKNLVLYLLSLNIIVLYKLDFLCW